MNDKEFEFFCNDFAKLLRSFDINKLFKLEELLAEIIKEKSEIDESPDTAHQRNKIKGEGTY